MITQNIYYFYKSFKINWFKNKHRDSTIYVKRCETQRRPVQNILSLVVSDSSPILDSSFAFSLQVVKMLIIVVCLFVICWLPLQIYNLLAEIYSEINM